MKSLVITAPLKNSIHAAVRHLGGDHFQWTWIGEEFGDRTRAKARDYVNAETLSLLVVAGFSPRSVPGFLDIHGRVHQLSLELRQAYIDYVGAISRQQPSDWWRSSVSEKNPYISNTFFHACCIKACLELATNGDDGRCYLLIVEDPVLRLALNMNLKAAGFDVRLFDSAAPDFRTKLRKLVNLAASQSYFLQKYALRVAHARYRHRLHRLLPLQTPLCVTNIWIDLRAYVAETGGFQNLDFSGVGDFLRSYGKTVVGLANIRDAASYSKVTEYIRRSPSKFLVPESFLKMSDLIACVWGSFIRRPRRRDYPPFAGLQISDLILQDLQRDWYTERQAEHLLIERWVQRLKNSGIQVERFIYPFENHTWERVICHSLKAAYPSVRLIGYQPNGLPLLLLNYFISEAESRSIPLPDRIVANGEYTARLLTASGFGAGRIVVGGGLRQSYLQGLLYGSDRAPTRNVATPKILVTPSIGRYRTVELIHKVVRAFEHSPEISIIIKCHPSMRFEQLRPFLGSLKLPDNVSISTESILQLLPTIDALVYNDGTFPAAEALAFGIPAVFVEPEHGLRLDSLDGFSYIRRTARTPDEIAKTVLEALKARNVERSRSEGLNVVRQLVGQVTEETFRLFAD